MKRLPKIQVRKYGFQGREVLVLHGGPGAPGSASGLAKALADDFQILEPIQRRSGLVPLTVERHVEDLAEVAPECCAIVGHSWGAMLALSYASQYPERVTRLMLIGCGAYNETCRAEITDTLKLRLGEAGLKQVALLQQQLTNAQDSATRDAILRNLGGAFSLIESYELIETTETARDELPADAQGHDETWQDVLRLQREGLEPSRFSAIDAPVMLIHGDTDPHPGASTRELLKAHLPQLEYLEFERCGHEPWRELYARDQFLATLRIWLNR
jgi:pimeloyl-ACP methyl ester carboxylesterase